MDRPVVIAPQNELQFLISLLHIANPGQPPSQQSWALEELLSPGTNR